MRCQVQEIRGATIINDAYNSNPTAMRAALELLREFDAPGRRIVVSGDMGELGDESAALHWELGKQVVDVGAGRPVDRLRSVLRDTSSAARVPRGCRASARDCCENVDEALPYLGQAILPGDVVLVKGSRMMAMERVVDEALRTISCNGNCLSMNQ